MKGRARKTAAVGAAAFVLAGSAVLAAPGEASADTITAKCGDTITAKPGDVVNTPFGARTITDGVTSLVGGLLNGLCTITVHVVDTAVAPVPVVGAPVAGAVDNTVAGTTNSLNTAVQQGAPGSKQPASQQPAGNGGSQQSGPNGGTPAGQGAPSSFPVSNSPVLAGSAANFDMLPFGSSAGFAPMRDYSGIPFALAGLWSPSPGLRYGGEIPGYTPEVGALGQGSGGGGNPVQNAGEAQSLSGGGNGQNPVSLPMLIAVLSLSGVSAALVRRWVLRGSAA